MMPKQLARARRPKRLSPRPIVEDLVRINVCELAVPRDWKTYSASWIDLKYPQLSGLKVSWNRVEFRHASGRVESFALKRIKTGLGGYYRHAFICHCGRAVTNLYFCRGEITCVKCSGAIYASQTRSQSGRKALQFIRLCEFIRLFPKPTRKTKQRLQARLMQYNPSVKSRPSKRLIPNPIDQNPWAHWRSPM